MARFSMVYTDFWKNPIVLEEMTPEDRYFYLYLLTNPNTTQIGIYKITKKQMAFDLGYSFESVNLLMERFISHHKLIRYNSETRELAIKYWGKDNLQKSGKPMMDCIFSELKDVDDRSLIQYVAESIPKKEICSLYQSFCEQEEMFFFNEVKEENKNDTYEDSECEEVDDTLTCRYRIGGQKKEEKENEKQQQEALYPYIENNQEGVNHQKLVDVKETIEFWDYNGSGLSNINAKQQLVSWLENSRFLQPYLYSP